MSSSAGRSSLSPESESDPDPKHWLDVPELVADLAEQVIVVIRGALLALSPDPESDPDPQHWLDVPELVADLAEQLIVVIRGALLTLSGSEFGSGSATLG